MSIVRLDHFNLAPLDMEKTVRFYEDVIGLSVGYRPDFGVDGYWMYAGEQPVLHLLDNDKRKCGPTGRLDHIAFWATGLEEFLERLDSIEWPYGLRTIDVANMHQVFLKDPDGVLIEVGFCTSEEVPETAVRTFGL